MPKITNEKKKELEGEGFFNFETSYNDIKNKQFINTNALRIAFHKCNLRYGKSSIKALLCRNGSKKAWENKTGKKMES